MNILESLPTEVLTAEAESALARRIQAKPTDEDTVNELVLHNMADGFRYMKRCCRNKIADDELFSLCYRILRMNALRFRPGRVRFLAFSKQGLRGAIARFWNNADVVKHSSQHDDADAEARYVRPNEPGYESDEQETQDWIARLVTGVAKPSTYVLTEPSAEADFGSIDTHEKIAIVSEIIERKLTEQESMIIELAYTSGFNFPEIGRLLGVTRSAIQLAHAKAIKKIRAELGRRKLLTL